MDVLLLSLLVLGGVGRGLCQTGSGAKNLLTKLMVTDEYNKNVLPLLDQGEAVEVHVSFLLHSINGLDEVTETLTTTGYLVLTWRDEFLVWDPDDYGGIHYYHWPQDDIWKPDVTLQNSIRDYKELGDPSLKVLVQSDGVVNWYPFQVFQSSCKVDITYFPFDVQTCHLTFATWSYTWTDVEMIGGLDGIDLREYEKNSLWEIIDSSWSLDEESEETIIVFTIKMKRKPLYFILSVILSIVMLAVLNVFVFTLPCESGERAGYAITVFLALVVFLTIVAQSLPANSDTIAIVAIYVIILTFQSTLTTVIALLTIRMSTKETEVPAYLAKFTEFIHRLQCTRPKRNNSKVHVINVDDDKVDNTDRDVEASEEVTKPNEKVSWSTAVRAIDFVLFVFSVTTLIVSTIVCFIVQSKST